MLARCATTWRAAAAARSAIGGAALLRPPASTVAASAAWPVAPLAGARPQMAGATRLLAMKRKGAPRLAMNDRIRVPSGKIRLINHEGENCGIVPLEKGLEVAREQKLDLVQIQELPAGEAEAREFSPVCKVIDYKKHEYDQKRKEQERRMASKHAEKSAVLKEIKMGTSIGENDLAFKVTKMRNFLLKGHRVQLTIVFRRSRTLLHAERAPRAHAIIDQTAADLEDCAKELGDQRKHMGGIIKTMFVPVKGKKP